MQPAVHWHRPRRWGSAGPPQTLIHPCLWKSTILPEMQRPGVGSATMPPFLSQRQGGPQQILRDGKNRSGIGIVHHTCVSY